MAYFSGGGSERINWAIKAKFVKHKGGVTNKAPYIHYCLAVEVSSVLKFSRPQGHDDRERLPPQTPYWQKKILVTEAVMIFLRNTFAEKLAASKILILAFCIQGLI